MVTEKPDVQIVAEWRADVYGLLSLGYHFPADRAYLTRVEKCAQRGEDAGMAEMACALFELVRVGFGMPEDVLRQDFHDLFMVPGGKYVTPYESIYHDAPIEANGRTKARTFGPSTQVVREFYRRVGLRIAANYTELPDYVGLELACMEYLCRREAHEESEAVSRIGAMERVLLQDHLVVWIPGLVKNIHEKAGTAYYKAKATVTLSWIQQEAQRWSSENSFWTR
ncbi:MAG: molecular chaperone TorD family protein [Planctomycetes bacterium]|nr:molecular chaperone TorD family protein [Planctomycetota bacterium]